ncbi:MAG: thiamine-monophosphate kinase, partial [Methanobacteriota archaeon]
YATAMTDISDGVAVGAHNIADASGVGIALDGALPLVDGAREDDVYVGEDYELLFTLPREAVDEAREAVGETGITVVGEVVEDGVRLDGEPLRRRGYEH